MGGVDLQDLLLIALFFNTCVQEEEEALIDSIGCAGPTLLQLHHFLMPISHKKHVLFMLQFISYFRYIKILNTELYVSYTSCPQGQLKSQLRPFKLFVVLTNLDQIRQKRKPLEFEL